MTKRLQNRIALICAVCLLCALLSGYAAVDRDTQISRSSSFEKLPVYVDGTLEYTGYMIDGTAYVPLRSFCSALNMGAVVTWNSGSNTMYVSLEEAIVKEKIVEVEVTVTPIPATPAPTAVPTPALTPTPAAEPETEEFPDITQIPAETPALAEEQKQTPAPVNTPTPVVEEGEAVADEADELTQQQNDVSEAVEVSAPAATPETKVLTVERIVTETTYKRHSLSAEVGEFYMYVNDRVIYLGADIINYCGNVLVPLNGLCTAFGITASRDAEVGGLNLKTNDLTVCKRGSKVYNQEDLYWLSRIINAEAGNQSLEGQICVGNVVLNRVASKQFPDSIKEVIFSPNQFCPVRSGTIYCTPDADAITAAKLCLEGVNMAGQSTYFVNPETGVTAWFRNNLTFYGSVGDHDFYY